MFYLEFLIGIKLLSLLIAVFTTVSTKSSISAWSRIKSDTHTKKRTSQEKKATDYRTNLDIHFFPY